MKMKTWKFLPIMAMGVKILKKKMFHTTHLRVLIPRTVALQQMMI